jgi:hypothetical protein
VRSHAWIVAQQINSPIKTLQADLSKKLSLVYKSKDIYGSLVWSGIYDLSLKVGDDVHESGYEQMKVEYPDINDQFDQFIVRYLNVRLHTAHARPHAHTHDAYARADTRLRFDPQGTLTAEQIVRLKNGFPTTEREAKEFDEKQKANDAAMENYVRNLVKVRRPWKTRNGALATTRHALITGPPFFFFTVCGAQARHQG